MLFLSELKLNKKNVQDCERANASKKFSISLWFLVNQRKFRKHSNRRTALILTPTKFSSTIIFQSRHLQGNNYQLRIFYSKKSFKKCLGTVSFSKQPRFFVNILETLGAKNYDTYRADHNLQYLQHAYMF